MNYGLASALYNACQGDSGTKEYEARTATAKGKTNAPPTDAIVSNLNQHMRVYFPSRETVQQSKGGMNVCPPFPHTL